MGNAMFHDSQVYVLRHQDFRTDEKMHDRLSSLRVDRNTGN